MGRNQGGFPDCRAAEEEASLSWPRGLLLEEKAGLPPSPCLWLTLQSTPNCTTRKVHCLGLPGLGLLKRPCDQPIKVRALRNEIKQAEGHVKLAATSPRATAVSPVHPILWIRDPEAMAYILLRPGARGPQYCAVPASQPLCHRPPDSTASSSSLRAQRPPPQKLQAGRV